MTKSHKTAAKLSNPQLIKRQGKRSYKEDLEIKQLEERLASGAPPRGVNPLSLAQEPHDGPSTSYAAARTFDELPLCQYTKDGLRKSNYITLTAVQRAALPHGLAGRDVLGAAKTGSGKTLAFLLPVVEKLYRLKWTPMDGLGALVLTPTRELAVQIFEELKKVGHLHDLSAGLLIGGKAVKDEAERVSRMTILVATPGRLLQHMDETPGFNASNLQVLVLDEADRILDMGFAATLDAIIANLPQERQTMLFSATQTKSVRDLARLSLADPEYLAVHAEAANPTPLKLQQAYMVVDLGHKLDVLWSFIRTHLKARTIVFFSTCKQVRFVFEAFRKLRPGVPLRCLHGGMKQAKRTAVFYDFCQSEGGMVLLATDIAARGLDFPTIDWVVQADCPEDAATYIHRVGRTARYMAAGRALLLLLPSEAAAMLAQLAAAKIPLTTMRPNPAKQQAVSGALQALLSKDPQLKEFAQKALTAYLRSVFLQPNKAVFDVLALPAEDYATSLGLATVPKLRFLRKVRGKQQVVEIGGRPALGDDLQAVGGSGDDDAGPGGDGSSSSSGGSGLEEEEGDGQPRKRQRRDAASGGRAAAAAGPKRPSGAPDAAAGDGGGSGSKTTLARKAQKVEGRSGPQAVAATGSGAAGPCGEGVGDDDDDDDDFLKVKKRNVFADEEREGTAEGDPEDDEDLAAGVAEALGLTKKKKKKKQKIKVGHLGSGSRIVFDEEGAAMDPLERLAAAHVAGADSGGEVGGDSGGGTGVYVVSERPEERFKLAASLMRARDKEDKQRLKQLKKEFKLERKARKRAAQGVGGGSEEGEEDDGPVTFTLGRPAGDDSDGGLQGVDSGDGSDGDDGGGHARGGNGRQAGRSLASSGSGGGGGAPSSVVAAHIGMARRSEASAVGLGGSAARPQPLPLSLADQEALALKLLMGSRR